VDGSMTCVRRPAPADQVATGRTLWPGWNGGAGGHEELRHLGPDAQVPRAFHELTPVADTRCATCQFDTSREGTRSVGNIRILSRSAKGGLSVASRGRPWDISKVPGGYGEPGEGDAECEAPKLKFSGGKKSSCRCHIQSRSLGLSMVQGFAEQSGGK
jgi:hypothetical protein